MLDVDHHPVSGASERDLFITAAATLLGEEGKLSPVDETRDDSCSVTVVDVDDSHV
jgi:hypothetical protein